MIRNGCRRYPFSIYCSFVLKQQNQKFRPANVKLKIYVLIFASRTEPLVAACSAPGSLWLLPRLNYHLILGLPSRASYTQMYLLEKLLISPLIIKV